eukprot:COSAG04_NODE_17240_length_475_cov_0.648936_1_plen_64_part_10
MRKRNGGLRLLYFAQSLGAVAARAPVGGDRDPPGATPAATEGPGPPGASPWPCPFRSAPRTSPP